MFPVEMEAGSVSELKLIRGEADGFMQEGCLGEVHGQEEVRPVVLEVVDKGVKVLVDVLVQNLHIAIHLQVVGG